MFCKIVHGYQIFVYTWWVKQGDFGPWVDCNIEDAGKWAVSGTCLFLEVPLPLQCVIVAFPDHSHLFFYSIFHSKSKEEGKDQETIQSSTTPDPGYHMGK